MDEPATPPGPHARFPYGPALLCAACLGMAAWTWMRYSYCQRMTADEAVLSVSRIDAGRWPADAYVELDCGEQRVAAAHVRSYDPAWRIGFKGFASGVHSSVRRGRWSCSHALVMISGGLGVGDPQEYQVLTLEAAGRFHPASVAGLVVAAFGAFVFALYLRRWLVERKAVHASAAVEEEGG